MKKKTIIIGIETSCDETAVSILRDNGKNRPKILSNVVSSQFEAVSYTHLTLPTKG